MTRTFLREATKRYAAFWMSQHVDWTEAIDIFNAYGLKLNPVT